MTNETTVGREPHNEQNALSDEKPSDKQILLTDGGPSASAPGPSELPPREARDRFLEKRRLDATDRTLRTYQNRLTRFCEWCEANEVHTVGQLNGWLLDEYRRSLSEDSPTTVKGKMMAVKQLIGYLEEIGAVEDGLEDAVPTPKLSRSDERSNQRLESDDALALIRHFRNSIARQATPEHVTIELIWFTGARMSGIRALDVQDYDSDSGTLRFKNRPDTGTRLKNGNNGERSVAIPPRTSEILDEYLKRERFDKRDEHGRSPLVCCRSGRPSNSTIRAYCYLGTHPCLHTECPHGKQRHRCKYTQRNHASKCPSARGPHAIRTGSISWQLNQGIPIDEVAERVNASPDTIRRHYDVATEDEKLEQRRRQFLDDLTLDEEGDP